MVVYFNFKIHQEEITKTICVQKDLVLNTCNGRCVLDKKLNQLESQQKKTETSLKEKFELVYTTISTNETNFNLVTVDYIKEKIDSTLARKYEAKSLGIFRPPLI